MFLLAVDNEIEFYVGFFRQLLSYYQACNTFYHQGYDLCKDYEDFFKGLSNDVRRICDICRNAFRRQPDKARVTILINYVSRIDCLDAD